MAYTTVVTFTAGDPLAAADLNSNFSNLDYLNAKINSEIQISAAAMQQHPTSSASPVEIITSTYSRKYATMAFPDGSISNAVASFVLPSDYNGGSITARFLWTANSTSTNSVVWGLYSFVAADDVTLDLSFGSTVTVVDANKSTAYDLNITAETAAHTPHNSPSAGKVIYLQIYRDPTNGSDTLAATAYLLSVVLTYTRS